MLPTEYANLHVGFSAVNKHYRPLQGWPQNRVVPDPAPVPPSFWWISDVPYISKIIESAVYKILKLP